MSRRRRQPVYWGQRQPRQVQPGQAYRRRPMRRGAGSRSGGKLRLMIGVAMALFALVSYFSSRTFNPVTGETQHVSLTPHQEIALGLQAAPQMIQQHGGLLPDQRLQNALDSIGARLVNRSVAADTDWQYEFHLLADRETINAFALPGGQVFMTTALLERLDTEAQVAGVIGHEIAHVVARHGAQRLAKQNLTQGLTGAVMVASGDGGSGNLAAMIGNMVNMKYGREDELESDKFGVQFMADAGYDPRAMIRVMEVLAASRQGEAPPEFFSTHPNPENRIARIEEAIREVFPAGVPGGLTP